MIIQFNTDKRKRVCAICHKPIAKGKILVKYERVIDGYKNTRMWFAHIACTIKELKLRKIQLEKEMNKIPDTKFNIEEYDELRK